MLQASSVSKKSFSKIFILSENSDELCDRWILILQEKQAGNNSHIINEEIFAIADELLEYKSISKKKHKQI